MTDRLDIPEEKKEKLSDIQKKDLEGFRVKQTFADNNSKGTFIIDDVSDETYLEYQMISRKYFGGKRGATLAALVQMFLAEKLKQKEVST